MSKQEGLRHKKLISGVLLFFFIFNTILSPVAAYADPIASLNSNQQITPTVSATDNLIEAVQATNENSTDETNTSNFLMDDNPLSPATNEIKDVLKIQLIQVCDDEGMNCANPERNYFEEETKKVWEQAGVDINYLEWVTINDSTYEDLSVNEADENYYGNLLKDAKADTKALKVFFVNSIASGARGMTFGVGTELGIAISNKVFDQNTVLTLAHEIGNALGLTDNDVSGNLMNSPTPQNVSVESIGEEVGKLTEEQIDTSRNYLTSMNEGIQETRDFYDFDAPTTGLLGTLAFDGGADGFGPGSSFTQSGNPVLVSGRTTGQALNFDGTDDALSVATNLGSLSEFTISAWVKLDILAGTEVGGNNPLWTAAGVNRIVVQPTGISVTFSDGVTMTKATDYNIGSWINIILVKSLTKLEMYRNSTLIGNKTFTGGKPIDFSNFRLGHYNNAGANDRFNGAIDDFRIYNRVLNVTEVGELCSCDIQVPVMKSVAAFPASSTSVDLTFSATDNDQVASYTIYRDSGSGTFVKIAQNITTGNYTNTGLVPGTTYRYQVEAYDKTGNKSQLSSIVTARPAVSVCSGTSNRICTALTGNQEDVQSAIDQAREGDTVVIPEGTWTWTKGVTVGSREDDGSGKYTYYNKSIIIQGAGIDKTIIRNNVPIHPQGTNDSVFTIYSEQGKAFRLTNMTMEKGDAGITRSLWATVRFVGESKQIRVDHIKFNLLDNRALHINGEIFGLIDNNQFITNGPAPIWTGQNNWGDQNYGDGSWAAPLYLGTEKAIYIEHNVMTNVKKDASGNPTVGNLIDGWMGSRYVVRYNTLYDSKMDNHGTESSARWRGARGYEIYGNTMIFTGPNGATAIDFRSGNGVVYDNSITGNWNNAVFLNNYRDTNYYFPYGEADGTSPFDFSDLDENGNVKVYKSGIYTPSEDAVIDRRILTMISKGENWTPNQWVGYSIRNVKDTLYTVDDLLYLEGPENPNIKPLRVSLTDNRKANAVILAALTNIGVTHVANASDQQLVDAFNQALNMSNLYSKIDMNFMVTLDVQPYLTKVQNGETLAPKELYRLNAMLLASTYKDQIRGSQSTIISSNTTDSISGVVDTSIHHAHLEWRPGDHYEITRASIALDQIGRGAGDLLDQEFEPSPLAWPQQEKEPLFIWNNTFNGVVNGGVARSSSPHIVENRDYFNNTTTKNPDGSYTATYMGDDGLPTTWTYKPYEAIHPLSQQSFWNWSGPLDFRPEGKELVHTLNEDEPLTVTLRGFDSQDRALTYTIVDQPKYGTLTRDLTDPTGARYTYTPNANFNTSALGREMFSYKVNNGTQDSTTSSVALTVRPVNDAPVFSTISNLNVEVGSLLNLNLLATDADAGDKVTYEIVGNSLGSNLDSKTGALSWTPLSVGNYSLQFRAIDSKGVASETKTLNIDVQPTLEDRTIIAKTGNAADVQAAIDRAQDGDTVIIPEAPVGQVWTWTQTVNVNLTQPPRAITIKGAGPNSIIIDDVTRVGNKGSVFYVTTAEGKSFRMTELTFRSGTNNTAVSDSGLIKIDGDSKELRVDHNQFFTSKTSTRVIETRGSQFGLIDNNYFESVGQILTVHHDTWGGIGDTLGDGSWADPISLGSEQAIYFENNTVINTSANKVTAAIDAFAGARYVIRANDFLNYEIDNHGVESPDRRSARSWEIYDNVLTYTIRAANAVHIRGGTGVVFNNTIITPDNLGIGNIVTLNNYRSLNPHHHWGTSDGTSPYDVNDLDANGNVKIHASGVQTNLNPQPGVLTVTGTPWTGKDWTGYSLRHIKDTLYTTADLLDYNALLKSIKGNRSVDGLVRAALGNILAANINSTTVPETLLITGLNVLLQQSTLYKNIDLTKLDLRLDITQLLTRAQANEVLTAKEIIRLNAGLLTAAYPDQLEGSTGWYITSNTNNTITVASETTGQLPTWNLGDTFEITRALAAIDQPGRSTDQIPIDGSWPDQKLDPIFVWGNKIGKDLNSLSENNSTIGKQSVIQENREFYVDHNGDKVSFDSSTGIYTAQYTDADGSLKVWTYKPLGDHSLRLNNASQVPVISAIPAQNINEDGATGAIAFTIGDQETMADDLILSVSSSNTGLISNENIVLAGSEVNRTIKLTPTANQNGFSDITITVKDSDNKSTTRTFRVTVNSINDAPVWDVINPITMNENGTQTIVLSASDVEGNTLTYSGLNLPSFVSINGNQLTINPNFTHSGNYVLNLRVNDGTTTVNQTVSLTVNNMNRVPVLSDLSNQNVGENELINVTLPGSDPDGDALTYTATGLPAGATLIGNAFLWTPEFNQSGNYLITFTVSDGNLSATKTMNIAVGDVNRAPMIDAVNPITKNENEAISLNLVSSDLDGDPLTITSSNLPSGATLSGNTFSWTPNFDQAGSYTVTFRVSDGNLFFDRNVVITINNLNRAPIVPDVTVPAFNEDGNVLVHLGPITDADSDVITLSIFSYPVNGALIRDGLDPMKFTYIPTANFNGADSFTYQVTDGTSIMTKTIHLTINSVNDAPEMGVIPIQGATENQGWFLNLEAKDADGEALVFSATGMPEGMVLQGNQIQWLPGFNQAGMHQVTITVSDGVETVTRIMEIVVVNVNRVPTIEGIEVEGQKMSEVEMEFDPETTLSLQMIGNDLDGETLHYYAELNRPENAELEVDEITGSIKIGILESVDMRVFVTDGISKSEVFLIHFELRPTENGLRLFIQKTSALAKLVGQNTEIKKLNTVVLRTNSPIEAKKEIAQDLYTPSTLRKDSLEESFIRSYDLYSPSSRSKDYEKFWTEYLNDLEEDEKKKTHLEANLLTKSATNLLSQPILAAPTGVGAKMGEHLEDFFPDQNYLSILEEQMEQVKELTAQDAFVGEMGPGPISDGFIDPAQLKAAAKAHQNTHAKNQKIKAILDKQKKKS